MNDEEINFQGAHIDTRPEEEKQKDIHQVELVSSAAPVEWKEKKDKDWRKFPEQNQKSSSSCVAQTIKKLALILFWLKENTFEIFSATSIYTNRSNKPSGGMIGVEAFDIWKNKGIALESMVPSNEMGESAMDAVVMSDHDKEVAKGFAVANHVGLANRDFEGVASTIQQTGKGVMVWFYFNSKNNYEEWKQKFPKVLYPTDLYADSTARHSVAAVDFGLINGKKYLKIEDSALFGGISERWISEEFFAARNWFVRYPMNFKYQDSSAPTPTPSPTPAPGKPKHTFTQALEFIPLDNQGKISNVGKNAVQEADVKALQDILRYEGLFPINVASTGYYGATTAKAVYNWQVKHAVAPMSELDAIVPKGGRVGNKTITKLNSLYA